MDHDERAEQSPEEAYEPPRLEVLGTFEELTAVKSPVSSDGTENSSTA
jgi:hypothetical protein